LLSFGICLTYHVLFLKKRPVSGSLHSAFIRLPHGLSAIFICPFAFHCFLKILPVRAYSNWLLTSFSYLFTSFPPGRVRFDRPTRAGINIYFPQIPWLGLFPVSFCVSSISSCLFIFLIHCQMY
jgi:uncharacterized membrane protein